MQETEWGRDERGRQVIRRAWHDTHGQRHRTTGPAVEEWTVLPGGAHVLLDQAWYDSGKLHREGRPAVRRWHVENDGTRVLGREVWARHGRPHRVDGPSYRDRTIEPDGARTLRWERWRVNGVQHRVDGPALDGRSFFWHGKLVQREDLPWLRRGRSFLVALAGFTGAMATLCSDGDGGGSGVSPAWSQDARVRVVTWHGGGGAGEAVVTVYRSAVGGSVLLRV